MKDGDVFKDGDKLYLVRCPKCHQENCAMNVASGVCTWCGYVATEKDVNDGNE